MCLLYALVYLAAKRNWPALFRTWQARLFLILYLISSVSSLTAGSNARGLLFNPQYTSFLFLLIIIAATVDSRERLRGVLLAIATAGAVGSIYALRDWQKYHGLYAGYRPSGAVADPNYFALTALMCLPIACMLALNRQRPRWERWYCFGCLGLMLAAFTLAASRGGFFALMAGVLFFVWKSRNRTRNLAVLAALIFPLLWVAPISPARRLLNPSKSDHIGEEARAVAWRAGLRMIKTHPLMGVGVGRFKAEATTYENADESTRTIAHNTYIELAAEMGLPALFTFVMILYISYRTLAGVRRVPVRSGRGLIDRAALAIQSGLVGYAIGAFFISAQYEKMFWLLVFVSAFVPRLLKTRYHSNTAPLAYVQPPCTDEAQWVLPNIRAGDIAARS
jgi:O-antigen ligase